MSPKSEEHVMENVDNKKTKTSEAPMRRRNYRPLILAGVLVVAVIGIIIAITSGNKKSEPKDDQPKDQKEEVSVSVPEKKEEEKTEEKPEEEKKTEEEPEEEDEYNDKTPAQNEGGNPNKLGELTGVVNYTEVVDDELVIRVTIDQYLSSGTCMLKMYAPSTGDSYDISSAIEPTASTSSCSGFNIPLSNLMEGKYNITVDLESGNKKGTVTGEVEIQ